MWGLFLLLYGFSCGRHILYCDLSGRIKAAAHTFISRIVDAFNMTNIERSIKELLN